MISYSNERVRNDCAERNRGELAASSGEPRAVGQLMAAVLARYGVSASGDSVPPRLPHCEPVGAQLGEMLSVG